MGRHAGTADKPSSRCESNYRASVQPFTFTTPVAAAASAQHGRALFTGMHDFAGDSSDTAKARFHPAPA